MDEGDEHPRGFLCNAQVEEPNTKAAPIELHGFKLVKDQFVSEYNSHVLMYRHEKTGLHRCHTSLALPLPAHCQDTILVAKVLMKWVVARCMWSP